MGHMIMGMPRADIEDHAEGGLAEVEGKDDRGRDLLFCKGCEGLAMFGQLGVPECKGFGPSGEGILASEMFGVGLFSGRSWVGLAVE